MGRPKGSKNKKLEQPPSEEDPSSDSNTPPLDFSAAVKGKRFGREENDKQKVFQLRLLKPAVVIRNQDVLDYFGQEKAGKSLFGLQSLGGDLLASFRSEVAREEFLALKTLKIGKAEVHVAIFPAGEKKQSRPTGAKYVVSGVPMETTGAGLQKALHNLCVERYLFERYPNSQVRTGRAIFWTASKGPSYIYIAEVKAAVKQMGLPRAPPNTPESPAKMPPASSSVAGTAPAAKQEDPVREEPETPTRQAQKDAANLAAGATPKRKDVSPLASLPAKAAKFSLLESDAPLLNIDFLQEINLPIPTHHAVLSIYEDVTETDASVQNQQIESPLSKKRQTVVRAHPESDKEDRFVLSVKDEDYDEDTVFKYYGEYRLETTTGLFCAMRWVQMVKFGNGLYMLVLFKSRIWKYRQTHGY